MEFVPLEKNIISDNKEKSVIEKYKNDI